MSDPTPWHSGTREARPHQQGTPANLADILERVLDKGVVIAGDIRIDLLDIELLTIKLRLLVASVDRAKEMGIDWWEHEEALSSQARQKRLARENQRLRERLSELEEGGAARARNDSGAATAERGGRE